MKEVTMKKARLITLVASLCLMAFSLQGAAKSFCHANQGNGGGDVSWFDGL
jgi:hypothetical protein